MSWPANRWGRLRDGGMPLVISQSQGKPWTRYAVRHVLTNPARLGLCRHRPTEDRWKIRQDPELGITGIAEWAAIVDEPTWRAAVRVLCDPSRRSPARGGKVCSRALQSAERAMLGASRGRCSRRCPDLPAAPRDAMCRAKPTQSTPTSPA